MWELVSFALIHEITHWVSVSDLSSSSWWNKRIPWNSTRPMWLCLCRGKLWLWGKPCDFGPLPTQTAAPLGACCGFLPLYTLVSFQNKSKHTGRWCTLVCVPGWGWAAHQALEPGLPCCSLAAVPNAGDLYSEMVQCAWEIKTVLYLLLLNTLAELVNLCFQVQSFLNRTRGVPQAGCPSLAAEVSWKAGCLHCGWHHHSSRHIQPAVNLITM